MLHCLRRDSYPNVVSGMAYFRLLLRFLYFPIVFLLSYRNSTKYINYPSTIRHYHIRTDHYSGETVTRKRLELLGGLEKVYQRHERVTLEDFRKRLQCAPSEPSLNGNRGSISLLRAAKPSRETMKILAVYFESMEGLNEKKGCSPWSECHKLIEKWIVDRESKLYKRVLKHIIMYRIIDGRMYADWPWSGSNLGEIVHDNDPLARMPFSSFVLNRVKDLKDSVFFYANSDSEMRYGSWGKLKCLSL